MPDSRLRSFPTLVVTAFAVLIAATPSFAAKTSPSESLGNLEEIVKPTPDDVTKKRDTVDIGVPPDMNQPISRTEYFYPYRRALSFRIGQATRSLSQTDNKTPTVLGTQFFFTTANFAKFEIGADLISDGTGALHIAERWVFTRTKMRPFAKAGLGVNINPKDQLAAFAKYDQFMGEASAGSEFLIRGAHSARAEIELAAGLKTVQFILLAGYVWAW